MTLRFTQRFAPRMAGRGSAWLHRRPLAALIRRPMFALALAASALASVYWCVVASDRYTSQATVIIQRTDLGAKSALDVSSLLAGSGGADRSDQLLLRNYMLSVDMLDKLDAALHLRAHYSDRSRDPLSRMWSDDIASEQFHEYFLSRVSVDFDEYAGVLVVKAQAFDPRTAQAIARTMVAEGERTMNAMAHALARDQVGFVERQVAELATRYRQTRQAVLRFQNDKGLVSPQDSAAHLAAAVNALEGKRTELQTQRTALLGYLAPQAPGVVELDTQIAAIDKQIAREQARLAAPAGKTLNGTVEEFQRLELEAGFAQDVYKTALVALERGRVEATRNLKKVTLLQKPTLPEYPVEPRRFYNTLVFILIALLLAGVAHLLAAIIRDHKD
jgi:capsular polysaccharide transport system permease protein